jgi:hypothetical protein
LATRAAMRRPVSVSAEDGPVAWLASMQLLLIMQIGYGHKPAV